MDFTVTIVTCNRAEGLRRGLEALTQQDFPAERIEVIVADNGSRDHTASVARSFVERFENFHYLYDARPGQLVGWHRALAVAHGELTCFIDDDARPAPGWLSALDEAYRDPRVGLATGPIRLGFDTEPPDWLDTMKLGEPGNQTLPFLGLLDCGRMPREIPANFVWGTNFSVRRNVLMAARGFHPCAMPWPLIRFYGDGEIHVGRMAQQLGLCAFYHPAAAVDHDIPYSRLTLESVMRKFTTTGCARAFQTLRGTGQVFAAPTAEDIRAIARRYFANPESAPRELVTAVESGLNNGVMIQRNAFIDDPLFRDWVLHEDYLDLDACYVHPDLLGDVVQASGDWRTGAR